VEQDQLFERLWNGEAAMEEWTATVSGGAAKPITDDIIATQQGVADSFFKLGLIPKQIAIRDIVWRNTQT